MVSLIVHAVLGVAVVALVIRLNPQVFSRPPGPALSGRVGLLPRRPRLDPDLLVLQHAVRGGLRPTGRQPDLGSGKLAGVHRARLHQPRGRLGQRRLHDRHVILLPLFTIIDGRRRGIRQPWLFFVASLFTSFAFAFAFYFATIERQRRHQQAAVPVS